MGKRCENCGRPIPETGKYNPYCSERCKEEAYARFNEKKAAFKTKKVTFGMRLKGGLFGILFNVMIAVFAILIYSLAKNVDPDTCLSFLDDLIVKIGVKPVLIGMVVVLFIPGFLFPKLYLKPTRSGRFLSNWWAENMSKY